MYTYFHLLVYLFVYVVSSDDHHADLVLLRRGHDLDLRACMYIRLYECIYIYIYTYIVCMYIRIYIYIYTYRERERER